MNRAATAPTIGIALRDADDGGDVLVAEVVEQQQRHGAIDVLVVPVGRFLTRRRATARNWLILKWRDVRVVEGARFEIDSASAC
jgi:hypothetical protein